MGQLPVGERSFFQALAGDGRPPLVALALGLLAAGGAALFLAATRRFLPHDEQFLGMTAADLCARHGCRVVHFMVHDRAAFGGVLVAVGLLYLWLGGVPLRGGAAGGWWGGLLSGLVGLAGFRRFRGCGDAELVRRG